MAQNRRLALSSPPVHCVMYVNHTSLSRIKQILVGSGQWTVSSTHMKLKLDRYSTSSDVEYLDPNDNVQPQKDKLSGPMKGVTFSQSLVASSKEQPLGGGPPEPSHTRPVSRDLQ